MAPQKDVFHRSEGDCWYEQSRTAVQTIETKATHAPEIFLVRNRFYFLSRRILDNSCSNGWQKVSLRRSYIDVLCTDIEPYSKALAEGRTILIKCSWSEAQPTRSSLNQIHSTFSSLVSGVIF